MGRAREEACDEAEHASAPCCVRPSHGLSVPLLAPPAADLAHIVDAAAVAAETPTARTRMHKQTHENRSCQYYSSNRYTEKGVKLKEVKCSNCSNIFLVPCCSLAIASHL